MRRENAGHTLQISALVNEAYLRLIKAHRVRWQNRSHFFAVSAQIMRRILVDFRAGSAEPQERWRHVRFARRGLLVSPERGADLLALHEALERLGALNARQSQVVELRYFGGLNDEEVVEALKVSPRTVLHDWSLARAWLYREPSLGGGDDS